MNQLRINRNNIELFCTNALLQEIIHSLNQGSVFPGEIALIAKNKEKAAHIVISLNNRDEEIMTLLENSNVVFEISEDFFSLLVKYSEIVSACHLGLSYDLIDVDLFPVQKRLGFIIHIAI